MESFSLLLGLIGLVFAILQIVLFFKVWEMTNDVKRIVSILEKKCVNSGTQTENVANEGTDVALGEECTQNEDGFYKNQLVVCKQTEEQMRIVSFTSNGSIVCRILATFKEETFSKNQIEDFDKYWAQKKK